VVSGLLVEIALQVVDYPPSAFSPWIYDAETAYQYAPDLDLRMARPPEYDVAFVTNSLGLRDDEIGPKRGARILILGDSFTSGYGVERSEMFVSLLEDRLDVEVVNAGVGGFELVHQLHYFDAKGRAFDADLVVLLLYLGNDLSRNHEWRETESGGLESVSRSYPTRTRMEFKLGRLYTQMRYSRRVAVAARVPWKPFEDYLALCERELTLDARKAYDRSRELLGELHDKVAATGAEFVVAMFSYRTTVEQEAYEALAAEVPDFANRYDMDRPARELAAILEGEGIAYLDLVPALRAAYSASRTPLYFAIDGHFTAAGHALVAEVLGPELAQRLQAAAGEPAAPKL